MRTLIILSLLFAFSCTKKTATSMRDAVTRAHNYCFASTHYIMTGAAINTLAYSASPKEKALYEKNNVLYPFGTKIHETVKKYLLMQYKIAFDKPSKASFTYEDARKLQDMTKLYSSKTSQEQRVKHIQESSKERAVHSPAYASCVKLAQENIKQCVKFNDDKAAFAKCFQDQIKTGKISVVLKAFNDHFINKMKKVGELKKTIK